MLASLSTFEPHESVKFYSMPFYYHFLLLAGSVLWWHVVKLPFGRVVTMIAYRKTAFGWDGSMMAYYKTAIGRISRSMAKQNCYWGVVGSLTLRILAVANRKESGQPTSILFFCCGSLSNSQIWDDMCLMLSVHVRFYWSLEGKTLILFGVSRKFLFLENIIL